MKKPRVITPPDCADVQVVGIPRALLYYRFPVLWESFFAALGRTVVLSRETDKAIVSRGDALSIDECCLASKAYMGHVDDLANRCDAVFAPCVANEGRLRQYCTKFHSLPDVLRSTFPQLRVLSCLVDDEFQKQDMEDALVQLALRLGCGYKQAKDAVKQAMHAQEAAWKAAANAQDKLVKLLDAARAQADDAGAGKGTARAKQDQPLSILLVGHPYVTHDPQLGGDIAAMLTNMGAVVLFADETDHDRARKKSFEFSRTMPWTVNRELAGSIMLLHDHVDGIVLVSAFPCGPDSMTDDAIMRCVQGRPILNLTIDAQSGTAGLETRIESFVDILKYQQKGGYVR